MSNLLLLGAGGPIIVPSGPALWTPNDESGLKAWFDMTNPSSFSAGTWTKRWGTLNNFTSVSTGPSAITNGFSGDKDALYFDGNFDHGMTLASPGMTEIMFVIVLNVTAIATGAFPVIMNRSTIGVNTQGLQIYEGYGISAAYGNSTKAEEYTATFPGQTIIVCQTSTNLRAIRYNGDVFDSEASVAAGAFPASTDSIRLNRHVGSATNWQCQVAAVGIFDPSSWSQALAEKIEGYVAHNNIGVTTAILPVGHPYKSSAPTV